MRSIVLLLAFYAVSALSSCGPTRAYAGDPLPRGDVAVIDLGGATTEGYFLELRYIDGREVEPRGSYEILPGRHVLEGVVGDRDGMVPGGPYALTFTAIPGSDYELAAARMRYKNRLSAEIVDNQSGARVAYVESQRTSSP